MKIEDLMANNAVDEIKVKVVEKGEVREFDKFGKTGRVCNFKVKDGTGEINLSLFNEDIDEIKEGDQIKITKGWCKEFRGEKQISKGKFGELEVMEKTQKLIDDEDKEEQKQESGEEEKEEEKDESEEKEAEEEPEEKLPEEPVTEEESIG